jgi:tetratricopeptide (TPR) repeat protein
LQLLSDSGSFKRAQSYVRSGAVEITARSDKRIDAIVSGTEDYSVRLLLGGREAESHCTCPAFAKGIFCKHLIATAIVARDHALSEDEASSDSATPRRATATADSDLRVFLAAQPAERLAGWLTDLAETDPAIERRLRVYQSQHSPRELRKALGRLLRAPRFLDWRASRKFARDLDPVIELLAELTSTDAHNGIELYEYALTRLFKIYEQSDDSGGDIGDRIRELVRRYLDNLVRSTPADAARAKAVFELQREDQWSFLPIEEVWPLLDNAARAVYAKAIEDEFQALPPRSPTEGNRFQSGYFWPTERMEALAAVRGDTDTLIAVISQDLTSGHSYERVVAVCEAAGRHREATQWAERGLKAHPDWRGMRPILARQYERAGLTDEALELYWQDFQRQPTIETWQALKNAAGQQWPRYRTRALEEVCRRERALPDGRRDASLRTRLLVADHDFEAARVLAEQHALAPELLDSLSQRIAATHPECAAGLLRRFVDAVLPRCQPRHYAYQAQQIARILALSPGPSYRAWVNQIRVQYSARRKFIAQLDAAMTPGEGPNRTRSR